MVLWGLLLLYYITAIYKTRRSDSFSLLIALGGSISLPVEAKLILLLVTLDAHIGSL